MAWPKTQNGHTGSWTLSSRCTHAWPSIDDPDCKSIFEKTWGPCNAHRCQSYIEDNFYSPLPCSTLYSQYISLLTHPSTWEQHWRSPWISARGLGLIKPLSSSSYSWTFNSFKSINTILYGAFRQWRNTQNTFCTELDLSFRRQS